VADEDNQSRNNLKTNVLILAALLVTGTAIYHQEANLDTERPSDEATFLHHQSSLQDIQSRLWEDPFTEVESHLKQIPNEKVGSYGGSQSCAISKSEAKQSGLCFDQAFVVLVPGGPYASNVESRRRIRYAVVSAFNLAGFSPSVENKIGYIRLNLDQLDLSPPSQDKTKTFDSKPEVSGSIIPFEQFERIANNQTRKATIFWVDEDDLNENPLARLSKLQSNLCRQTANCLKVIGPYASTVLRNMKTEISASSKKDKCLAFSVQHYQFFSYGATYKDDSGASVTCPKSDFVRTIANDYSLAQLLKKELKLRGLDDSEDVVLVSEFDTFYGNRFPCEISLAFERPLEGTECTSGKPSERSDTKSQPRIVQYSYLRGLDGQSVAPSSAIASQKKQDDQNPLSSIKSLFWTQPDPLERPDGPSQLDYLRRIAKDLKQDYYDQNNGEKKIGAIGVVGSDEFDKMLIIRALKPEFPSVMFFTTDLDANLLMPAELNWTRNLIVASGFGFELRHEIQKHIPPFRSAYQTSAFLAARLALNDSNLAQGILPDADQLKDWLKPHVFEITRTGEPLDLGSGFTADNFDQDENTDAKDCAVDLLKCRTIQPATPHLFKSFSHRTQIGIASGLLFASIVLGMLLFFNNIRSRVFSLVFIAFVLCLISFFVIWLWPAPGELATWGDKGEPLMLAGVSIWPTVVLRALGFFISVALICHGLSESQSNLKIVAKKLDLSHNLKDLNFSESYFVFPYKFAAKNHKQGEPFDVEDGWKSYVWRSGLAARMPRAAVHIFATTCVCAILFSIFGIPIYHARNPIMRNVYTVITILNLASIQLLLFFVLDETLLCLGFVARLAKQGTVWPNSTRKSVSAWFNLPVPLNKTSNEWDVVDDMADLRFIQSRTRRINQFIIYPFLVVALMIVSRSTLFANYPFDPPILIVIGLTLMVTFFCAIALRYAAERARKFAIDDVRIRIIKAKGQVSAPPIIGQLETLLEIIKEFHEGSFTAFSQQPFVRALLLPITTIGGTTILEYLALP
jgi:hypothetical protein